jgi:hypothetical protein
MIPRRENRSACYYKPPKKKIPSGVLILLLICVASFVGKLKLDSWAASGTNTFINMLYYQPEDPSEEARNALLKLQKDKEMVDVMNQQLQERLTALTNKDVSQDVVKYKRGKMINAVANNLGGVFTGKSTYIVDKCTNVGISPILVASIMKHETGNGTSSAVRKKKNPGGSMKSTGGLRSYNTLEAGIDYMINNLKNYYIDEGKVTIAQIQKKYCPIGAKNDPYGTNKYWLPLVSSYYETMLEVTV